jgi:transglutaminase-like putative cysteine protease
VNSAAQRNAELLSRKTDPFVDNYRGVSLYKLKDLKANTGSGLAVSYRVEVYTVETDVRPQQIRISSRPSPMEAAYTIPTPLIPSDDPRIKKQADAIAGREENPYLKARLIYQWLLREGNIGVKPLSGGAIEALERKEADPYMAALLFCALARASGVAALPVAGVLVDRSPAAHRHFWAVFWIEGFGWIPLDPALGAGAAPASFNLRSDREKYYFGSLDNQRITFSRGQTQLSQMESRGRLAVRNRDYALQTLWEEAVGGIESYSSLWSDVTINGVYVQ